MQNVDLFMWIHVHHSNNIQENLNDHLQDRLWWEGSKSWAPQSQDPLPNIYLWDCIKQVLESITCIIWIEASVTV